jgi:hypothetical protein
MPCYTEKTEGLQHHQTPAPKLLGKCRPTDQGQKQHQVEQCKDEKGMETILSTKNKLVQDSQGNEENGYPVPDLNKTKIDYTKEPNKEHPEKRNH